VVVEPGAGTSREKAEVTVEEWGRTGFSAALAPPVKETVGGPYRRGDPVARASAAPESNQLCQVEPDPVTSSVPSDAKERFADPRGDSGFSQIL
jgi:hypothetical protein